MTREASPSGGPSLLVRTTMPSRAPSQAGRLAWFADKVCRESLVPSREASMAARRQSLVGWVRQASYITPFRGTRAVDSWPKLVTNWLFAVQGTQIGRA